VDRNAVRSVRGNQPLAKAVAADSGDECRLSAQRYERPARVSSRSTQSKSDRARHVRPGFQGDVGAHDNVEHEVANTDQSRLLHQAAGNDMTAQHDAKRAGLAYVVTLIDGMEMTDTRKRRAECRRGRQAARSAQQVRRPAEVNRWP
jgi:hypothetical protein